MTPLESANRGGIATTDRGDQFRSLSGDDLLAVLRKIRLSGRKQEVALTVLLAPEPISAREVSRRTGIAYSHTKALIRRLVARGLLERDQEGLWFQPNPTRWVPAMKPRSAVNATGQQPKTP